MQRRLWGFNPTVASKKKLEVLTQWLRGTLCKISGSPRLSVNGNFVLLNSGPWIRRHQFFIITFWNIDPFWKLFHQHTHQQINNIAIIKEPTTPRMLRYTTLWNIIVGICISVWMHALYTCYHNSAVNKPLLYIVHDKNTYIGCGKSYIYHLSAYLCSIVVALAWM